MTDQTIFETAKDFIIKLDSKYDIFNVDPENEELLVSFYMMFEPYLKQFTSVGIKIIGDTAKVNETKLFMLLMSLVEKVEDFETLKCFEKKQMIVNIIIMAIEAEPFLDGPLKKIIVAVLEQILPVLIDKIVMVSKKLTSRPKFKKFRRYILRKLTCGSYKKR